MLLQEQNNPSSMMTPSNKIRFNSASTSLLCPVCNALVEHVMETEPKYILQSEAELIIKLEQLCIGPKDTSVPVLLGIAPPPLPPLWTDKYFIVEKKNKKMWSLEHRILKKKNQKKKKKNEKKKNTKYIIDRMHDARQYRQSLTEEDHFEKVVLVSACKNVVRAKEDVMAEYIRKKDVKNACNHVCNK
jgi:hypothetical protein